MRCDFRNERSCSCAGRCEAIPAPIHISKRPPLINFTPLEKAIAAIALGAVLGLNIWAFNHAQEVEAGQARIEQEVSHHG